MEATIERCDSGWTGDRCTLPLHHEGPHSNHGPEDEARAARIRISGYDPDAAMSAADGIPAPGEIEDRFVFVDEDGDVYGPLAGPEVRAWILEDLILKHGDEDDTTDAEAAEYRAMDDESLIREYEGTTGARLRPLTEPTVEWRERVRS